jgi:hypothetical protein
MLTNQVSAVLSSQDVTDIMNAFNTVETKLPAHINLPPDQRDGMLKINIANKEFCADVIKVYPNIKDLMPAYINIAEMKKDVELFDGLDAIYQRAQEIQNQVADLMILAGNEAYVQALAVYSNNQTAAKRGLKGAAEANEVLSKRFAGQGKRKKAPAPVA